MQKFAMFAAVAALGFVATSAFALPVSYGDFTAFEIRAANGTGEHPDATVDGSGNFTVTANVPGMKIGIGTAAQNGALLSSIASLSYTAPLGQTATPYWNIWVTDGINKAALAPSLTPAGTPGAINGQSLSTLGLAVSNNTASDINWLFAGGTLWSADHATLLDGLGTSVTFSQLTAGLTIFGNGDINNPAIGDSGAAKNGSGIILMFGNIQGNLNPTGTVFVSDLAVNLDAAATAVPLPSAAMSGTTLLTLAALRRRRRR